MKINRNAHTTLDIIQCQLPSVKYIFVKYREQ